MKYMVVEKLTILNVGYLYNGAYDSIEQAQGWAKTLKELDRGKQYDIFVVEVED